MLIATTNPGKVREIQRALGGIVELVTLADLSPIPEPEETGRTFAENAALKARVYAMATGLPTVAEDSGLIIDALGSRPGVQSARYPGETYAEKFAGLYAELAAAGAPRPWTARFVCALAYVEDVSAGGPVADGMPHGGAAVGPLADGPAASWPLTVAFTTEGVIEGEIVPAPRGSLGFGYDPIFFYPPLGKTTGEMPDDEKLSVSHRGKAFRHFRQWLLTRRLHDQSDSWR